MNGKRLNAWQRLAQHRRRRRSAALRSGVGCVAFRGVSMRRRHGARPTAGAA